MISDLQSFKVGAWIPALQAVVFGAFFAGVVGTVAHLAGERQVGVYMLAGGAVGAFLSYVVLLRHWLNVVGYNGEV